MYYIAPFILYVLAISVHIFPQWSISIHYPDNHGCFTPLLPLYFSVYIPAMVHQYSLPRHSRLFYTIVTSLFQCIYSRNGPSVFTTQTLTAVLHHCYLSISVYIFPQWSISIHYPDNHGCFTPYTDSRISR